MTSKWTRGLVALALVVGLAGGAAAADDNEMTRDEYKAKVAQYEQRQAAAQADISKLDAEIADLNQQIQALDAEIARIDQETLRAVMASQAEVNSMSGKLDGLARQLEGLTALAPEELAAHRGEMSDVADQLASLAESSVACLPEIAAKIDRVNSVMADLDGTMPRQFSINYEVAQGDHLWGIASKEGIYADPYMWPRLYRANREQINDPDLIYPEQVLSVPFGVAENQYLVTSGDFLSEIAAAVYDDPTQWHRIYKANAEQIVEPNMIFPAQVLEIPSN